MRDRYQEKFIEAVYKKYYSQAVKYAFFRVSLLGQGQSGEDFAQYYCEEKLKNPSRSIKYVFIDYLRKCSGRKGTLSYDAKIRVSKPESIDKPFGDDDNIGQLGQLLAYRAWRDKSAGMLPEVRQASAKLRLKKRIFFNLYYDFGYTLKEIGEFAGYGEQRGCNILKEIKEDLKKIVESLKK